MTQPRFGGGTAVVGRAWTSVGKAYDPYAPEQPRVTPQGAALASGAGLATFGAIHAGRASGLDRAVAQRAAGHQLHVNNAEDNLGRQQAKLGRLTGEKRRGVFNPRRYVSGPVRSPGPVVRAMRSGRTRAAQLNVDVAQRELDMRKRTQAFHEKLSTPEVMRGRKRMLRRRGGAMMLIGTGLAAAPTISRYVRNRVPAQPAPAPAPAPAPVLKAIQYTTTTPPAERRRRPMRWHEVGYDPLNPPYDPYEYSMNPPGERREFLNTPTRASRRKRDAAKAPVSKTITQSRWGGNAEAGRAWPERDRKKDRMGNLTGAAIVGGGAAAAGGVGASAHARRAIPGVIDPDKDALTAEHGELSTRLSDLKARHLDVKDRRSVVREHLRKLKQAQKDENAGRAGLHNAHAAGILPGPEWPHFTDAMRAGNADYQSHTDEMKRVAAEKSGVKARRMQVGEELAGADEKIVANAARRKALAASSRRGLKIAGAGAATALGAAALSEARRGIGRPRRKSPADLRAEVLRASSVPEPRDHRPLSEKELAGLHSAASKPFVRGQLTPGVQNEKRVW